MLRNLIILPDGTEVSSGTSFSIKSSKLTESVNNGEELSLGAAQANMLEATLYDIGAKLSLTAGDEVTLYKVDEDGNRTKKGIFVLEKPTRPTANTLKLTAYDRMVKLDVDLTAWVNSLTGWPYTPLTFASMVCQQCGLTFATTSAPNADFPVHQFKKTGMTGRKIMHWLAEICCRFCRANADGNIEFGWYTPSGVTICPTGDRYYFAGGLTYENYTVAPIEAVQIRLAESASGALWPNVESGLNSYAITGNMILNTRITEDLKPYLEVIKNELAGVTYTPCRVAIPACLDVNAGNTVDIVDKNGKSITAYVMTKTSSGQRDVIECTGSARRTSTTAVNNSTEKPENASVVSVTVLYYLSTSNASLDGGEWSMVAPAWEKGKYIWSKTVTTYSDGTSSESDPACITGAAGEDGNDGVGVSSITTQFYLSSSKTTQTGGSWVAAMPAWSLGKYLWTRSKVTYTDGAVSYTSPICDSSWEAVDELDKKLDMEEVFNRLTKNGSIKGIYMEDGELYFNASYILTGELIADLIKAGVLRSVSGAVEIDLDNNVITLGANSAYRFMLNPVGITGRRYTGTAYNELLNIAINSNSAVITDNTQSDGNPRGISMYGKGFTDLGCIQSVTSLWGSRVLINGEEVLTQLDGKFPGFQRILTANDDMDSITDDGVYAYSTSSVPANAPFANAAVVMVFGNDSTTTQKIQLGFRYGIGGSGKFRALYDGSWHAWSEFAGYVEDADYPGCYWRYTNGVQEWVTPPMVPDVEYRTTERRNGKVVYTKYVDLGTFPASGSKTVTYCGTGATSVDYQAFAVYNGATSPLPYINSSGTIGATCTATAYNIIVHAQYDMSARTGFAIVKYTKD